MSKKVGVTFVSDLLEEEYLDLHEDDLLKKRINYIIERIKENPNFGRPITKKLIPKLYKDQGITNAYWIKLSKKNAWRLIYSLKSYNNDEIVAIIVEWFVRHKDYERRFGYN